MQNPQQQQQRLPGQQVRNFLQQQPPPPGPSLILTPQQYMQQQIPQQQHYGQHPQQQQHVIVQHHQQQIRIANNVYHYPPQQSHGPPRPNIIHYRHQIQPQQKQQPLPGPPHSGPVYNQYNVEKVNIENGKIVRKMPIKLGDGRTIWTDCVDLNQKGTNNTMVTEFDKNSKNSDQTNSVKNQQNVPVTNTIKTAKDFSKDARDAIVTQVTVELISPTELSHRHNISISAIRGWVKAAGKRLPSRYRQTPSWSQIAKIAIKTIWEEFQEMLQGIELGPASKKNEEISSLIQSEKSLPPSFIKIVKLSDVEIRILSGLTTFEVDHQNQERPRGLMQKLTIFCTQKAIYITNISRGHFGLAIDSRSKNTTLVLPVSINNKNLFPYAMSIRISSDTVQVGGGKDFDTLLFIDKLQQNDCERIIQDLRLTELLDIKKNHIALTFSLPGILAKTANEMLQELYGDAFTVMDPISAKENYEINFNEETKLALCSQSYDSDNNLEDILDAEDEIRVKEEGKEQQNKPESFEYMKLWSEFQDMLKTIRLGKASKEDHDITDLIKSETLLPKIPHQIVKLSCTKVHIWSYLCNHPSIQVYCTQKAIYIVDVPKPFSSETLTLVIPIQPNVDSIKLTKIKGNNEKGFGSVGYKIQDLPCVPNDGASKIWKSNILVEEHLLLEQNDLTCHFLVLETDDPVTREPVRFCERIIEDLEMENFEPKGFDYKITFAPLCPFKNAIEYELNLLKKFYGKIFSEEEFSNYKELFMKPQIEWIDGKTDEIFSESDNDDDELEENDNRTKKRKRNQSESNSDDDKSVTADIDFESYINGLKEKKLPQEFFVKILKDLTKNNLKKTEKLNSILLKEWMQSIEENHQLKAENERLKKLNEAMDVSNDHMFQHENIEIKQEEIAE